jgi:glycerol-3-phosphate acyltransferase PlsY
MLNINYGLILSCFVCYLFGSIPNGYLLVKVYCQKDIRQEGSGNVGTLNAFKVSKSKSMGFAVLVLDFFKGLIPVFIMLSFFKFASYAILIASIFIILGHNYPVWLKFKGGRGLASTAGVFILLNYGFLAAWCLIWVIYYIYKKDVLISNFVATLFLPVFIVIFKKYLTSMLNPMISIEHYNLFILFTSIISFLIIIKHRTILNKLIPFTARNL